MRAVSISGCGTILEDATKASRLSCPDPVPVHDG
ncbi:Uncharacterised protein [Mycobacteroides abscessus subsp. abscessus]|nr:Uncharacterised protein [Mycobacteroides abscessus subsp. abscessus]